MRKAYKYTSRDLEVPKLIKQGQTTLPESSSGTCCRLGETSKF